MITFQDKDGKSWTLDIRTSDVWRVKKLVKDREGKPVDLLVMTERADFAPIKNDIATLVDVLAVLCHEEIQARFSVEQYDRDNAGMYEMIPELRDEPQMKKAFRWFADQICSRNLPEVVEAFIDAMINFTPSLHRREALKKIHDAEKNLEEIHCRQAAQKMAEASEKLPEIIETALDKQVESALTEFQQTVENPASRKK